jgi:TRAP-type C4-dicarboxylate transport system permease small subunit
MVPEKDAVGPARRRAPDAGPRDAGYGLSAAVERITRWLAIVGGGLLLVAIVLTLVSVIGRYGFSQPLPGDYEIVEIVCAIGVFLFFPYTHATNSNITAEFFTSGLSERSKRFLDVIHDIVFALVAALLTWRVGSGLADKYLNGETSVLIGIPLWWAYSFAVLSMALLTIVCLWRITMGIEALRR